MAAASTNASTSTSDSAGRRTRRRAKERTCWEQVMRQPESLQTQVIDSLMFVNLQLAFVSEICQTGLFKSVPDNWSPIEVPQYVFHEVPFHAGA